VHGGEHTSATIIDVVMAELRAVTPTRSRTVMPVMLTTGGAPLRSRWISMS
jgi:hypothetical protein